MAGGEKGEGATPVAGGEEGEGAKPVAGGGEGKAFQHCVLFLVSIDLNILIQIGLPPTTRLTSSWGVRSVFEDSIGNWVIKRPIGHRYLQ